MSGKTAVFSRDTDLTGLWSGEYWYDAFAQRTPFTAHFIDMGGNLSGTTLEPATFGAGPGDLSAEITGARGELSVRFTKLYDPAPGVHRNPIFYDGTVDPKFTLIEGNGKTITWNVCAADKLGVPLSVTTTLMVFVPGATDGVQ